MSKIAPNKPVDALETRIPNAETSIDLSTATNLGQEKIDITPYNDAELDKIVANEAFFHEKVVINVHETSDENDLPYVDFPINDRHFTIVRGVDTVVPRFVVSALINSRTTKYRQKAMNIAKPEESNELKGKTALSYPFAVVIDNNPAGREWLKREMAKPA